MADRIDKNSYPNFKINGRIFPVWILKNFAKYKLPEIVKVKKETNIKKSSTKKSSTKT